MTKLLFTIFILTIACVLAEDDQGTDVTIVSRSEWRASPPRHTPPKLETIPPNYVIISHTGSPKCLKKSSCINHVRNIQVMHQKQYGWNDIAYNYLVGGDGNVYEGRGWDVEGAHTIGYNQKSIGIAFIGDFRYTTPTPQQLEAGQKLIALGVQEGKIGKEYKLLGQKQVGVTQSPGDKLYNVIKTWDHWTEKP